MSEIKKEHLQRKIELKVISQFGARDGNNIEMKTW